MISDQDLLKQCIVRTYIGSGPGGQHRNKTQSGVSITLQGTSIEAHCCDDRSAHINKQIALRRLRLQMALQIRNAPSPTPAFPFPGSNGHINESNEMYAEWIADCLDRIEFNLGETKECALAWGISNTALIKILFAHKGVLQTVQAIRQKHQKPLLKNR